MSTTARLTAPRPFKGDLQASQTWIYRIEAYIRANATLYADDDTKIYLVLGLCDGNKTVTKWAEAQYSHLANTQATFTPLPLPIMLQSQLMLQGQVQYHPPMHL